MGTTVEELKKCADEAVRLHELYPYNRIKDEIFRRDIKIQDCKLDIIVGLSLLGYCRNKIDIVKGRADRLGTLEELNARALITDKVVEKIVDKSFNVYNSIFAQNIPEKKDEKFSWDIVFKMPQRTVNGFWDKIVYTVFVWVAYKILIALHIINPIL